MGLARAQEGRTGLCSILLNVLQKHLPPEHLSLCHPDLWHQPLLTRQQCLVTLWAGLAPGKELG